MGKELRIPIYGGISDGNVFHWILKAAEDHRKIRQRQRYVELEKLQFIEREKAKYDDKRHKRI